MFILRDYQQDAINSLYSFWESGKTKPIIVAPTGSGKSLIIAGFCKQAIEKNPNVRIMVVTDSRELIEQNATELKTLWEDAPIGIYSAGLGRRQTHKQIIFAGIQSIYDKVNQFPPVDVVIVDECHMIPRSMDTRYGRFIHAITQRNQNVKFWGCTATPYRLDSGLLHEGDGALFDGISYSVDMQKLIENNYLVPIISKGGINSIDTDKIKIIRGDYDSTELIKVASDPELVKGAVDEVYKFGYNRNSWLIFAAGVRHAHSIQIAIPESKVITGTTPTKERDLIINQFKTGQLKCLINVGVLIKGFNAPNIDLLVLMTATKSTCKYVQMCGRGMRTADNKKNCLLLDFGNNVLEHGYLDDIDPNQTKISEKKMLKVCPDCRAIIPLNEMMCNQCGYIYPTTERSPHHEEEAYGGAILTSQIKPMWIEIRDVKYRKKQSANLNDNSFEISYVSADRRVFKMFLYPSRSNFAAQKAANWIKKAGGYASTIDEMVNECNTWMKPCKLLVRQKGRFWDVLDADYLRNNSINPVDVTCMV